MNDRRTTDWRPLAWLLVAVLAQFAIIYRFLPFDVKAFAPWPFAAWALYSGARLGFRISLLTTLAVFAATDVAMYLFNQYPPNVFFYVCLVVYVMLGRRLLSTSQATWRIGLGAIGGYAVFFLISNFAAWIEPARAYYKPYSISTLLQAYGEGLEFLRMQPAQPIGALLLPFVVFGLHAALATRAVPAEQAETER